MLFTMRIAAAVVLVGGVALVAAQTGPLPPTSVRIVRAGIDLPSGHSHDYFNRVIALREHHRSWSLRDQAQLNALTRAGVSTSFTYDYANDPYPWKQDGAKLYHPDDMGASIPRNQTLDMPIDVSDGTVLVINDFWFGPEWRTNRLDPSRSWKPFMLQVDGGRWWTHAMGRGGQQSDPVVNDSYNSLSGGGTGFPTGVTQREPLTPPGEGTIPTRSFFIHHGVWTRYWFEVRLYLPPEAFTSWMAHTGVTLEPNPNDPQGRYHMISSWIADEHRGPVRLTYQAPWRTGGTLDRPDAILSHFQYEFHTSQTAPSQSGPLIGYGRNVVALRNYRLPPIPETDTTIFVRPVP
jgi:hypothetical protein